MMTAISKATDAFSTSVSFWDELLDTHPLTASGQTRLDKAIARLDARPAAGCIVVVHRKKVVGIATRKDLMVALAQRANWQTLRLSTVMTRQVITVVPSAVSKLSDLLNLLIQHQISYLPVIDEKGQLIGTVNQSRLLSALLLQLQEHTHSQKADCFESHRPHRAQLFADITIKIRQSLQLTDILQTTVDEIQKLLKADRVLIYRVFPDSTGKAISEAVVEPYPSILDIPFPEEVFPEDYQALYAKGRVRAISDVHAPEAEMSECLVEFIDQWSIKSKLIVPIVHPINPSLAESSLAESSLAESSLAESSSAAPAESTTEATPVRRHLWGLLIAHQCDRSRQWSEFELDLMQQLAGQISLALSQGQLMTYLEERVKLRTAELTRANRALKREIHDRKQIEKALRRSEAQLRLITNNLPVLIAYVDCQQRYQFNNHAYQQWLGASPEEIQGATIESVVGQAHYQTIQPYVETALAGQQVTYESELTFVGQPHRSVSVTYVPHLETSPPETSQKSKKDRNQTRPKKIKGFFALTTDISDRKAIERMKDEFLAVVSHELRTPLTSIHTSLKLLATGRLGELQEEGQEMLTVADENTDRLVRLVNNVLDLQRIEAGKVTMDTHGCDAVALVEQAAETMQTLAQQHNITISIKTNAQASPLLIWADPDYIIQTLTNLIGNAIKFSEPGKTVYLSVKQSSQATAQTQAFATQNTALFCVQDQGQGIPSDKLTSIFERFQQVDSSDARQKGGTGLGLAICRKIVEQHGGQIWAKSQLQRGSRFYFTVPLARTQDNIKNENNKTNFNC